MAEKQKQIELKLYGLAHEGGGDVRADVFVRKMQQLLQGLRAADTQVNGQKTLDYLIKDLKHSSAYAAMSEFQYNVERVPDRSAIESFHKVAVSVKDGHGIPQGTHPTLAKTIANIASEADKSFSHGEIGLDGRSDSLVRIDKIFNRQATRAYREYNEGKDISRLFEGVAYGSFKGTLKVIDLRGTITSAKLILTVGGIELDCTGNSVTVENLKDALGKEVIVNGVAHYNGTDRLPEHVEIKKIEFLGESYSNLSRWNGAFNIPPSEGTW